MASKDEQTPKPLWKNPAFLNTSPLGDLVMWLLVVLMLFLV